MFARHAFLFEDTPLTEIYTLSLHDALPISQICWPVFEATNSFAICAAAFCNSPSACFAPFFSQSRTSASNLRSEEHTSELQSRQYLVCRLLLEKKKHHTLTPNTNAHTAPSI